MYKLVGRHAALVVRISVSLAYLHVELLAVDALVSSTHCNTAMLREQAKLDAMTLLDEVRLFVWKRNKTLIFLIF